MNGKKKYGDYFLGLDIGTNSVGYAVSDEAYNLLKFKGEPMWGVHLFDDANSCEQRRTARTARKRLDRRQQRVALLQELFAKEVSKVDERFFVRIQESALHIKDKSDVDDRNNYFNDINFSDKDYYEMYPTVHHLICALMKGEAPKDVRLVYIACAWLVAHRGHFLSEVGKENLEDILDITSLYQDFMNYFTENNYALPWENVSVTSFGEILKEKKGIRVKEKGFYELITGGKTPSREGKEEFPFSLYALIKLLSGGEVKPADLFTSEDLLEVEKISLGMDEENFNSRITQIGDVGELLIKMKALYDWAILHDLLNGHSYISEAKVEVYEKHKSDLRNLKKFIRKYIPEKYEDCFRSKDENANYVAYARNSKNVEKQIKKASSEDFCKYISKITSNVQCEPADAEFFNCMQMRLQNNTFMPMQVNTDNRVIPYQLYWIELKRILDAAEQFLPFMAETDNKGISVKEKILKTFEFKIPYFVGSLRKDNNKNAWIVRNEGYEKEKILPWNFEEVVDFDKSEQEFIRRMTNTCTYLPGEKVVAKNSLIYSKFTVLNEINNIKVNGCGISVEDKQRIYTELFLEKKKVSIGNIRTLLGLHNGDILDGIDTPVKSSLTPYIDFKPLLVKDVLSEKDVEKIIETATFIDDSSRLKKWLNKEYSSLPEDDKLYISRLKYKDFGRLSAKFLNGIEGVNHSTGELGTILHFLWETNYNLMQIIKSEDFSFAAEIERINREFYTGKEYSLNDRMNEMYVPNGAKRSVIRTMDVVDDIVKATGHAPKKIFVEMARDNEPKGDNGKGRRRDSRYQQLLDIYESIDDVELRGYVRDVEGKLNSLGENPENILQRETVFLYFTQLGRCMYSKAPIDFSKLKMEIGKQGNNKYDRDHIYPRSIVKDDSVLNNKVLVKSQINGAKDNNYPLPAEIRENMRSFWKKLLDNKLITEEKFKRLTRKEPFSNDEKWGFINRQLVETRQSTKAVATILKERFPETEIVYVKAGLSSDFKHEFDIVKSRIINDLHHAKDAYLSIVVGNVWHGKFTRQWFNKAMETGENYSVKTDTLFKNFVYSNGKLIWEGWKSVKQVKDTLQKNRIHLTKYAYKQKGELFNLLPVKRREGLVPRKKNLDPKKYGGYNSTKAAYFTLVRYSAGKKTDVMLMPVEILYCKEFESDTQFALEYAKKIIKETFGLKDDVTAVEFLLNKRPIKYDTVFSLDGFNVVLKSKTGKQVGVRYLTSFVVEPDVEKYIKRLESFYTKYNKNPKLEVDELHDGINAERNLMIYDMFIQKCKETIFVKAPTLPLKSLEEEREKFINLSLEEQVCTLIKKVDIFKTNTAGKMTLNMKLSNWKKKYKEVYILDVSPSGLFEKTKSQNLMELL